MTKELNDRRRVLLNTMTLLFFLFSVLCIGTALITSTRVDPEKYVIPQKGGIIGPVEIPQDNAVYLFNVSQNMRANNWTYITIEILDKDKKFIYAFGDELWNETGKDKDGNWSESHSDFDMKITFDEAGTYYFQVVTEASDFTAATKVLLRFERLLGSSVSFWWLGFIALGVGIIINEVNRRTIINWLGKDSD